MENQEPDKSFTQLLLDYTKSIIVSLLNIVKVHETDTPRQRLWKRILSVPIALLIVCISPVLLAILLFAVAVAV
jgi:hypothetical protein